MEGANIVTTSHLWHVKRKEKKTYWRRIHSPFFFDLARHLEGGGRYVDVDYDSDLVEVLDRIEGLRLQLLKSRDNIEVNDYGAGSRIFKYKSRSIKTITRYVLQSEGVAFSLLRVLLFWRKQGGAKKILEMGTSLGLTTAYLAASGWEVETWEGCQQTANYAKKNWKYLGCENQIKCEVGTFKSLMDNSHGGWDVVFLDGHHDKDATLDYVECLKTKLRPGGAILVDDIIWSKGMKEAWSELLEDPHWNATLNWRGKGWLFNRDGEIEQHLKLRKSYISLSKFNKMKLFTIALAAITLLMSTQVQAQATKDERNVKSKSESSMSSTKVSKIYGELLVSELQGATIVKVVFDNYLGKIEKLDPSLSSASKISEFKFSSIGQALNILSSHGWNVDHVWTTMERTGTVQHLLVSHEVYGLSPLEPWLDKSTKRERSENRD